MIFAALACIFSGQLLAQGVYDVSKISPALIRNASFVVRNEEEVFELKDPGSATYTHKKVVTILNKNGERASGMVENYDGFSNIYNLKASLYDEKGNKIKDYRSADFKDASAVPDGTMYMDSRVKHLDVLYTNYPYTVEFSYSVDYNGIRGYQSWHPVTAWEQSVEKSSFIFRIPESMTFKYLKSKNLPTDSVKLKDKIQYTWSCSNLEALEYESMSTGLSRITPWVNLAPNQFEYDKSKANIENWKNLGTWMYNLSSGMQVLPESVKANVLNIVKDAKTPNEKIKLLYNHLQKTTRYVGVQLGIGGNKPIAAEKVCAVNYGDCKGLSNYMKAMLDVAGIKSHLVIIGNDMPSLNKNFASMNQANHMILCVPLKNDTTWLECTSAYVSPGFIGNDNSNRTVLLITEEGGKLAQTPTYSPASNLQKRSAKVNFDDDGTASIQIETEYQNAQYEDNLRMMLIEPVDQRKRIMNSFTIPNMQITNINYTQPNKDLPVLQEKISLKSSQLLTGGAGKLFVTLNMLNRQETAYTAVDVRKTGFAVKYGYLDEDEVTYTIPKGYKVEFLPKDVLIESEFGRYTAKVVLKDNLLVYTRSKLITNKDYPPEKYNDFVAFNKKLYQADKAKGILAKIE